MKNEMLKPGTPKSDSGSDAQLATKVAIAIDPEIPGGVAVSVFGEVGARPMPVTEAALLDLLRAIKTSADKSGVKTVCVLERVSASAVKSQPGVAMFKFGEGCGFIKGVVRALGIELELVRRQTWQKAFGLGPVSRRASKAGWENKLKIEVQRRFPQLRVKPATAKALLILEWASRTTGHDRAGEHGATSPEHQGKNP